MPSLTLSDGATRDLERLYAFLAQHSESTALKAIRTIIRNLNRLLTHPALGRPAGTGEQNVRELTIAFGQSAYIARYRVTPEQIVVTGLRHGREQGFSPGE